MSTIAEITRLEEQLLEAELGPDPSYFERVLADEAVIDGQLAKKHIVQAHRPGAKPKFTKVEMTEMEIYDHGVAAVVTCKGTYEMPEKSVTLKFMRVWVKKAGSWQIVAGTTSQ